MSSSVALLEGGKASSTLSSEQNRQNQSPGNLTLSLTTTTLKLFDMKLTLLRSVPIPKKELELQSQLYKKSRLTASNCEVANLIHL
jgi:hypothetical protein